MFGRIFVLGLLVGLWSMMPAGASAQSAGNAQAAKNAASTSPACRAIQPFYWEIGTKNSVVASGSEGDGSVSRDTVLTIASASKMVFGAYVIQKDQGKIDSATSKFLHMTSGYVRLQALSCGWGVSTVKDCFAQGDNSQYVAEDDNHFSYNGGHFQKWAVDHGLGSLDRQGLADEYRRALGADIPFKFGVLQLAGGLRMSAAAYAMFLQKVVGGQLLFKNFLGVDPVCTLPQSCPGQALRSPVRVAWHYSYAHWVEDAPGGDGAFSSPGAFGFYPWIDASKTYYGIVSRAGRAQQGEGAGFASALCGQEIRRAFFTSR
jgi:CubicO group peptidase (beta-lactamase class C family)